MDIELKKREIEKIKTILNSKDVKVRGFERYYLEAYLKECEEAISKNDEKKS